MNIQISSDIRDIRDRTLPAHLFVPMSLMSPISGQPAVIITSMVPVGPSALLSETWPIYLRSTAVSPGEAICHAGIGLD